MGVPLAALSIRPPDQQEGPLNAYAKALAIKGQMQQQQMGNVELQQAQMQLQDQRLMRQAMQSVDWSKPDAMDTLFQKAQQAGVSPRTLIPLRSQITDQQLKIAQLGKAQRDNLQSQYDITAQGLDQLISTPPAQRAAVYPNIIQGIASRGGDVSQLPQQYPGDDFLPIAKSMVGMSGAVLNAATKRAQEVAQTNKDIAQTGVAQAEAVIKGAQAAGISSGVLPPDLAKSKYQKILADVQSKRHVSADDLNWAKAYEASEAKSSTTSDSLGVMSSNVSRPSGLASVGAPGARGTGGAGPTAPSNVKSDIVDQIGSYKMDPALLSRMLYRHPEMLGLIREKYPDWDQTTYNAKNKLIQGYTSGTQSKEINAINTVMGHLGVLDQAVAALNNGNVQLLNQAANFLGVQAGQSPVTTFQTIVNRVGPEITSAYITGSGGEIERIANAKDFSPMLSPQQLHNNAAVTVKLLRSKIGALENQYKNTVGRDDFEQRFITPEAQAALARFAGQAATLAPGTIEDGYRFKGGDPSRQENWEKVSGR